MALERHERIAAIVPCDGVIGMERKQAIVARKRFRMTPNASKRIGAVVECRGMLRRLRQNRVEIRQRFFVSPKPGKSCTAIGARLAMTGRECEYLLKTLQRLFDPLAREQHIA